MNLLKNYKKSKVETDNDVIDTETEWKGFLSGIAYGYDSGKIDYKLAKEYAEKGSSVFIQNDSIKSAYLQGFIHGLDSINKETTQSLPIFRKVMNLINPGADAEQIIGWANFFENIEERKVVTTKLLDAFDEGDFAYLEY